MSENQNKFNEMFNRVMGALSQVPHRGSRIADEKDMLDLPWRILSHPVTWFGFDGKEQPEGKRNTVTLAAVIGWLDSALYQIINGQAAILAAVRASSEKQGIDPAELERLITEAVAKSAGTYELRKVEDTK